MCYRKYQTFKVRNNSFCSNGVISFYFEIWKAAIRDTVLRNSGGKTDPRAAACERLTRGLGSRVAR